MKRSILFILLGTCIISQLLWGGGQTEKAAQVSVTVWMKKGFVEQQNVEFEKRVNDFAKNKNIKVNVEMLAYEDIFPKWTAAIESKNVPDISFFGYQG